MTVASFMGISLWVIALLSLYFGSVMIRFIKVPKKEKFLLFWMVLSSVLWTGGYAYMNMSASVSYAYIGRLIGVVGVYGFITSAMRFVASYISTIKKSFRIIWIIDVIGAGILVVLLNRPDSVVFTMAEYGMTYRATGSLYRLLAVIYLMLNIAFAFHVLVKGLKRAKISREKKMIHFMMGAVVILIALATLDGLLPTLGYEAFPASCYGVMLFMYLIYLMSVRSNAFSITKANVSKYIFENVNTPVLIVNEDYRLEMANVSAEAFFDVKIPEDGKQIYDLFEITKADAYKYAKAVQDDTKNDSFRLVARNNQAMCEVVTNCIKDSYGDPICFVLFVNDMTKDYLDMEKLKEVKISLENELIDKSKQVEEMANQAITTIANFVDSKEEYTIGHSTRVAKYSEAIAKELGWSEEETRNIYYVGLLHDIGKIAIPHRILNKPSRLTDLEYAVIKRHTTIGSDILRDIKSVENVRLGALYHHERYDGSGYPNGLKGDEIPLVARIIGIADAYDAMTSDRKYRKHLPEEVVRDEFRKCAGKQFDPFISSVMLRMHEEGSIQKLAKETEEKKENGDNIFFESNLLMSKVLGGEIGDPRNEFEIDDLTQIWNRRAGEKRIREYLRLGDGALLVINLDDFGDLNDRYGNLAGDYVLKLVAGILKKYSKKDYLCRLSGDEFMLFLRDVTEVSEARNVVESIIYAYNSKMQEADILEHTSLSIGISLSSQEGRNFQQLFRCADRAVYFVKQNGKCGYSFHKRTEAEGKDRTVLELSHLVSSIKNRTDTKGAFHVGYQQFMSINEYINKLSQRDHQEAQLVLLTIDHVKESDSQVEKQERVMKKLEEVVSTTLRGVDIITRFSGDQILLTLMGTKKENVDLAMNRVMDVFYQHYSKDDVSIRIESRAISA